MYTLKHTLLIALSGIGTVAVTFIPMLIVSPIAIKRMVLVVTNVQERTLLSPAPTFWKGLNQLIFSSPEDQYRPIFYTISFALAILAFLATLPFIFYKPTTKMYLNMFTAFGTTLYFFGFSLHEKHIHFALLSMMLQPELYRNYFTAVQAICVWSLFPTACSAGNDALIFTYGMGFVALAYLFEWALREETAEYELVRMKKESDSVIVPPALQWLNQHSLFITHLIIGCVIVTYAIYEIIQPVFNYSCYVDGINEELLFYKGGFVGMAIFMAWVWLTSYHQSFTT